MSKKDNGNTGCRKATRKGQDVADQLCFTQSAREFDNKIGRVLRDHRTAKNLSQRDLARRAGVSVDFISRIERGDRRPSLYVLARLASGMGLRLAKLCDAITDAA